MRGHVTARLRQEIVLESNNNGVHMEHNAVRMGTARMITLSAGAADELRSDRGICKTAVSHLLSCTRGMPDIDSRCH